MKSGNQASGTSGNLKILGKTAGTVEPGQGTLHDPSLRQNLPFRFDAYRDINAKAKFAENIQLKSFTVSGIGTEALHGWIFLESISRGQNT